MATFDYICECGCMQRMRMGVRRYTDLSARGFVVIRGHESGIRGTVLTKKKDVAVVEGVRTPTDLKLHVRKRVGVRAW